MEFLSKEGESMVYKGYKIAFLDDVDENLGGYYCEVYEVGNDDAIDNFCIHKEELETNPDAEYWAKCYVDMELGRSPIHDNLAQGMSV